MSLKILVADDSIVTRHLLNATLTKWGYEVVLACDGKQAWDILQRDDAPSLAVLDWMMPGMSGIEVCSRLRERQTEPYTYVLLLTSKNLKEDLIYGMEAGADDYIVKPFDQPELEVRLRAARRQVELQNQLMKAREDLREQATKDSLTSLWNRSSILERLVSELARGERETRPVGLVILDLDHFKSINDTHGHQAGDAVLREAALRMRNSIRPYDTVGRYGGEEFLIVFPACDEQSTFAQAERLRASLAGESVQTGGASIQLSASFGCTSAIPGGRISSEMLIRRADEALYLAKRLGRNRVELLSSSPETGSYSNFAIVAEGAVL